jgi:hypothetical protein
MWGTSFRIKLIAPVAKPKVRKNLGLKISLSCGINKLEVFPPAELPFV